MNDEYTTLFQDEEIKQNKEICRDTEISKTVKQQTNFKRNIYPI